MKKDSEKPENKDQPKPAEEAAEKSEQPAEQLQQQLDALKKEKDDLFALLQRVSADYENYQKRTARQIVDLTAFEKEAIIRSLLPGLDNFEHVLAADKSAASIESLIEGLQIAYQHLLDILKSQGVEQIKTCCGEKFNPAFHQAIMQKSDPTKEDGVILEEFQKGYKVNGRVVRPGKVAVNRIQAEKTQTPAEPEKPEETETTDRE